MKRIVLSIALGGVIALGLSGSAQAADGPVFRGCKNAAIIGPSSGITCTVKWQPGPVGRPAPPKVGRAARPKICKTVRAPGKPTFKVCSARFADLRPGANQAPSVGLHSR